MFQARTVTGPVSGRINVDGRSYINFFGSGYLALSDLPEVRGAVRSVLDAGAPFAQQVPAALEATDPYFEEVERTAATALAAEASVYLPSGYLIGMALLAGVDAEFDHVLIDAGAHYSLKDAAALSGRPVVTFAHCDAQSLADELKRNCAGKRRPLVLTDGVFASSGQVPPLADYADTIAPCDGRLLIDESHAFGVVGANGRGAAEFCGVERTAMVGATLGKAFCAQGAVVACSRLTATLLRKRPPIRGAFAGSPLSAAAAAAAMKYSFRYPEMRVHLRMMADYLRMRLRALGLQVIDTPAPIVSFTSGSRADMLALQQRAWQRGICIYHSTYIGAGEEGMIRCAIFRDHSRADIDALVAVIQQ